MSNTHIRSAVESVVSDQGLSGYPQATRAVDAIVAAMESLADSAAESIRSAASAAGVSERDVEQALIDSGLVVPEPVPAVEQPAEDRLSKVEAAVASLVALAGRLGYRV